VVAFLTLLLALNQLAEWLGAPWLTGAWPERWVFLIPLAAAGIASWFMMEGVEGKPLAALGLPVDRFLPSSFGRGALLGISLMGLVVLVMVVAGALTWAREPAVAGRAAGAFLELSAFLAVAAFAEELLLRGYPLQVIAEALGGPAAILLTAVVFSGLHALNPHVSPLALVNIALAGILLGAALWRTMSLWFVTGVHFGWNWVMGVAADLPVSGVDDAVPGFSLDTPGIEAVLSGSNSLTGGSFGPEASWVVTAVTLAGIAWVMTRRRPGPALRVLALRPPAARRSQPRRHRVREAS
jgi:membrane protease YdiL (CAAX protease family)